MKICLIASANSIHTYRWAKYFADKGHEIHVISIGEYILEKIHNDKNIIVHRIVKIKIKPRWLSHILNVIPMAAQIRNIRKIIKPDVFHALGSTNGLLAAWAQCTPLIFTIADPGLYSCWNKYTIQQSELLVCDGENTKKAMITMEADPKKIKMIRYGVNLQEFKPYSEEQKIKVTSNCIVISTKPLRKECDVITLVKAIPLILEEIPEARFIIAGDGDQEKQIKKLINSLDIAGSISLAPNEGNIAGFLNTAKVFVNTSLTDTGLAASTTEAMACEIPVIVSDVGDNRLWIDDKFIFPAKDYEALAEKVIDLLKYHTNHHEIIDIKKAHRKIIEDHFDYHIEMAKMEQLYFRFSNLEHPRRPYLTAKINSYSPESVLEIGCGNGSNLYWLSKRIDKLEGIDIDSKSIEEAKKLLSNVKLLVNDMNDLSKFENNSFDIVFTDAVLMYAKPNQVQNIIQNMIRIAKKRIILIEWHGESEIYNSHIGNWTRNYKELTSRSIEITKTPEEFWPNKDWIKHGYIINIKI